MQHPAHDPALRPPSDGATKRAAERILEGSGGRYWRIGGVPDLDGFRGAPWPPLISLLLARRGCAGLEQGEHYFAEPGELTDAALMPGMEAAVDRLQRAAAGGETVAVFGDFDVDGITATTVLVEGLHALGARPIPYIPHRFTEGYGPNADAIRGLASQGATLLITADCGTSAVDEIAVANGLGMDVVVIDHHTAPEPPHALPDALAIVNPQIGDGGYGSEPAAVGVAYKVIHHLHDRLGVEYDPAPHRALVALGTVCDMAPMLGENRDLVRLGLRSLASTERPGVVALAQAADARLASVDAEMCGWVLGPRLNAAGRMDHGRLALDLLMAESPAEAQRLAQRLETLNRERRAATEAAVAEAETILTPEDRERPLLVVASDRISAGVVGLVASRLADRYHRPAIVIELADGEGRGSCRSIDGFDITALLRRHAALFVRFGGHRAAAGFTIDAGRLDEMRDALLADAGERLDPAALRPMIEVEAELPLPEVNGEFLRWLREMGPHGPGDPEPVFMSPGVTMRDSRVVGQTGDHLQFRVREGRTTWRAISFGNAAHAVPDGQRADIVFTFGRDNLRGGLQLQVLDLRPAATN